MRIGMGDRGKAARNAGISGRHAITNSTPRTPSIGRDIEILRHGREAHEAQITSTKNARDGAFLDTLMQTQIYQMKVWQKTCADLLNVVVMVKTNLKTQAMAHVVLFSSDLELRHDQLIDYYHLRFQIEFNFRDAKQYWGLEDFMTVNQTPVYNSANLAMFMVNLSHALIRPIRTQWPECSVNDLKAWFRGRKYVVETLKLLPEMPEPIFIDQAIAQVAALGRVNHAINSV
jgi:putative transposase